MFFSSLFFFLFQFHYSCGGQSTNAIYHQSSHHQLGRIGHSVRHLLCPLYGDGLCSAGMAIRELVVQIRTVHDCGDVSLQCVHAGANVLRSIFGCGASGDEYVTAHGKKCNIVSVCECVWVGIVLWFRCSMGSMFS